MYKLPKFFSDEISRQGKLTTNDFRKLKMTPEEVRKMEARWSASKGLMKESNSDS